MILRASGGSLYRVLQAIGSGGNATAYLVMCEEGNLVGCLAAIKVLNGFRDLKRFERFVQEIKLLHELHHPAIIRVYDEGFISAIPAEAHLSVDEFPFYAMEYYPLTLGDTIRSDSRIQDKLILAAQLSSALSVLAAANSVHRDIKPSNVFVSGIDCVLGDFGLVRRIGSSDHSPGAMAKHYPSPELFAYANGGSPPGPESDVFQLGLVLTELFTRQVPLTQDSSGIATKAVQRFGGELGAKIREVLTSMLEIDLSNRPSAKVVASNFNGILFELLLGNVRSFSSAL